MFHTIIHFSLLLTSTRHDLSSKLMMQRYSQIFQTSKQKRIYFIDYQ